MPFTKYSGKSSKVRVKKSNFVVSSPNIQSLPLIVVLLNTPQFLQVAIIQHFTHRIDIVFN